MPSPEAVSSPGNRWVALAKRQYKPIGILLLGSLLVGGTALYQNTCSYLPVLAKWQPSLGFCRQNATKREITILLADFEGARADLEQYRVTDKIHNQLGLAIAEYEDVKLEVLNRTITERDGREVAREEGKKHNAAIVIWGWYDKTQTNVVISANFEVLVKAKDFFTTTQKARGEIYTASIAELNSFKVHGMERSHD